MHTRQLRASSGRVSRRCPWERADRARVQYCNIFAYVGGNPLESIDPEGLRNPVVGSSGPSATSTYYSRGVMPRAPAMSLEPTRAAYEAAATMSQAPIPVFGSPLDIPCQQWFCPASDLQCGRSDIRRSSDFIPAAASTADPPPKCVCVRAGRDPAFQSPIDPKDAFGAAADVQKNWREFVRRLRAVVIR